MSPIFLIISLFLFSDFTFADKLKQPKENLKFVSDHDEPEAGQIFIDARVENSVIEFFWDTVANFTTVVGLDSLSSRKIVKKIDIKGLGGVSQSGDIVLAKDIEVGGKHFNDHPVVRASTKSPLKSTLGIDLFKNQLFCFKAK